MDHSQPGPGAQHPKDYRKQQLIEATIHCISTYGLSNTTISRVTQTADLSTGIANFYFSSKKQLLLETLQSLSAEYERVIGRAFSLTGTPRKILSNVIRARFDPQIFTAEKIAVWYAFTSESRARTEYMLICEDKDTAFMESLAGTVKVLTEKNARADLNPIAIARALEGLLNGYWEEALFQPDDFDSSAAIDLCESFIASVFPESKTNDGCGKASNTDRSPNPVDSATNTQNNAQSDLLAPWTYYSTEFLELEQNHLFKTHWLLAGHISDIPHPQNYLTFDAVGERALIIRNQDGKIRAFHNVCRHRGAKLVDSERGTCGRTLSCPFHGWTYCLDGELLSVPAAQTFENLDISQNGLVPLDLEIWMGFLFIRFGGTGDSVADSLEPIKELVTPYQLEKIEPIAGSRYQETRPYNWKIIHDIDNEGYHVPTGHPALQQLYGKTYEDSEMGGVLVAQGQINDNPGRIWSVRQYQKLLPQFDHLPDHNQRAWLYFNIFPSMVIGLYPESIEFYMTLPNTVDSTWYLGASYGVPDDRREVKVARYLSARINKLTEKEDASFMRWMQLGMNSSAFPKPKLSSKEENVRRFHKRIQSELPVAQLANEPKSGDVQNINHRMQTQPRD
ncbi:MAG: Rieske 2Fe-2S domain-containing protein [Proteobacteria bacterium]|nr:Rieske 2Fe-2S domain-containing protein [Pseudomonadota bacterium]MDB4827076.1 Rieske 2Fe-2S domain-containing protein [Gammaproteobacteria bacterium]